MEHFNWPLFWYKFVLNSVINYRATNWMTNYLIEPFLFFLPLSLFAGKRHYKNTTWAINCIFTSASWGQVYRSRCSKSGQILFVWKLFIHWSPFQSPVGQWIGLWINQRSAADWNRSTGCIFGKISIGISKSDKWATDGHLVVFQRKKNMVSVQVGRAGFNWLHTIVWA